MEITPSLTKDGALVFGSRHTTVFVVDAVTGELLQAFAEVGGALAEVERPSSAWLSNSRDPLQTLLPEVATALSIISVWPCSQSMYCKPLTLMLGVRIWIGLRLGSSKP